MIPVLKKVDYNINITGQGNISIGSGFPIGMMILQTAAPSTYDSWINLLMANGYKCFREVVTYQTTGWLQASKAALIRNIQAHPDIKYIWGVSCNRYDNPAYVITSATWPAFKQAILNAALWAQNNGVYEFQIGNEEEYHSTDPNESTVNWVIDRMLEVASEAKQIFTRGKISYSCIHETIDNWVAKGKGNIDILYSNVYYRYNTDTTKWKPEINMLVNTFGNECGLTEFGVQGSSDATYWANLNESQQSLEIQEMIDYFNTVGLKRAFYFLWHHSIDWGVVRSDGVTYRQVWNNILKDINK